MTEQQKAAKEAVDQIDTIMANFKTMGTLNANDNPKSTNIKKAADDIDARITDRLSRISCLLNHSVEAWIKTGNTDAGLDDSDAYAMLALLDMLAREIEDLTTVSMFLTSCLREIA